MAEPLRPKSGDDDDLTPSFKVKNLLREFFSTRGVRTPSGVSPATMIAERLAREGLDVEAGTADFLRCYADNLRSPPASWKHLVVSFESWIAQQKRGGVVEIRRGPQSQRGTSPQRSRYPLARLADPFETNLRAEAV